MKIEMGDFDIEKRSNAALENGEMPQPIGRHPVSRHRKTRSLYGVNPSCKFGPIGTIADNSANVVTIPDPTKQKLKWQKNPLTVLVVKKIYDDSVLGPFRELVLWLVEERHMVVYAESKVLDELAMPEDVELQQIQRHVKTFDLGIDDITDKIDIIICLGGDGTLLHASSLFQQSVPPVIAFHLGSLGFLTPFEFSNFREQVSLVLEGTASLLLRSRLKCIVCRKDSESSKIAHVKEIDDPTGKNVVLALNEIVVDRGQYPYLCNLDLYVEGRLVTTVQGDGLIICTPTGSTAYAVAAGASMMHPNVPSIMITPICPHSLSFRPIVVPAGVEIKVMVSHDARNSAWVSFDGRNRQEIKQDESVRITTSMYPVPSVCRKDQIDDWFDSLSECLHWNVRKQQNSLPVALSTASLDSTDSDAIS